MRRHKTLLAGAGLLCAGLLYGYVLIPLGLRIPCLFGHLPGLRCPGCGAQTVRPQWGPGRRLHCPLCGAPLVYDDEADGASEDDGTGREERWRASFRD